MDARFVAQPRFDTSSRIALRNGRILDVEAGQYMPAGTTLVVRGGTIESVADAASEPAQGDADVRWDLGGRAVLPGLFNTHTHLPMVIPALAMRLRDLAAARRFAAAQVERNMADCLAAGVTHVRDALVGDLSSNRRLGERIARGEIPGPRLHRCVQVGQLGGAESPEHRWTEALTHRLFGLPYLSYADPNAGTIAFAPEADEPSVRAAVDRAIDEREADAIKLYDMRVKRLSYEPGATLMDQAQLDAAVDQARKRGVPATMHHVSVESFRRGLRAGVSSLAHTPIDGPLDDVDAESFVRAGCILEPTLSIAYDLCWRGTSGRFADHHRLTQLDELREQSYRELVERHWVAELQGAAMAGFGRAKAGHTRLAGLVDLSPALRHYAGTISHGIDNACKLLRAGATFGCGNDAGAVPRTPAMVGLELALFEQFVGAGGASARRVALRSVTIDGAAALGVANRFGSISPGKVADLVVLDGDPLEDLSIIGRPVAALFMDGKLVVDNGHLARGVAAAGASGPISSPRIPPA